MTVFICTQTCSRRKRYFRKCIISLCTPNVLSKATTFCTVDIGDRTQRRIYHLRRPAIWKTEPFPWVFQDRGWRISATLFHHLWSHIYQPLLLRGSHYPVVTVNWPLPSSSVIIHTTIPVRSIESRITHRLGLGRLAYIFSSPYFQIWVILCWRL